MEPAFLYAPGLFAVFSTGAKTKRGVRCSPLRRAGSRPYIAKRHDLRREGVAGAYQEEFAGAA